MSRPGITYDDVVEAIQSLQKKDIYPSIDAVRSYLDSGSKTTINRHIQRYRIEYGLDKSAPGLSKDAIDLAIVIQKQVDRIVKKRMTAVLFEKDFIIRSLRKRIKEI